jgi:hypothetical protein
VRETDERKPCATTTAGAGDGAFSLAKASCLAGALNLMIFAFAESQIVLVIGGTAIVFGHIARRRLRRNPQPARGSRMALAGLVLGYIFVCLTLLGTFERKKMLDQARVLITLAIAEALELAATNFFIEYDKLPDVGARVTTNTPHGVELLNILLGIKERSANPQNDRQIKFLSLREGRNRKNGLLYSTSGNSVEGLFDSWGNPYTVILGSDDDEVLRFKVATEEIELKGRRVAVFSPGPDQEEGTGDDIRTW